MTDYLADVQSLESSDSKRRYLESALKEEMPDEVRDKLEDIYVDMAFEIVGGHFHEKPRVCQSLYCNTLTNGYEVLSLRGHRKIVQRLVEIKGFHYAEKYARNVGDDFEDILSPERKKLFQEGRNRLIEILNEGDLTYLDKVLERAKDCSSQSERKILYGCIADSNASPSTLVKIYSGQEDYENLLGVARKIGDNWHIGRALRELGRDFEYVIHQLENNQDMWYFESAGLGRMVSELSEDQVEQIRDLSRNVENFEVLASTYDNKNKWLAHSIRARKGKREAKTLYELVEGHANESQEYLETILSRKLSSEIEFQAKKVLTRLYSEEIRSYESSFNPGDGGPSIGPSESELATAKKYRGKIENLWDGDSRRSLMPENIDDFERKADLYIEEGDVSSATYFFKLGMEEAEIEMDIQRALRMKNKLNKLEKK